MVQKLRKQKSGVGSIFYQNYLRWKFGLCHWVWNFEFDRVASSICMYGVPNKFRGIGRDLESSVGALSYRKPWVAIAIPLDGLQVSWLRLIFHEYNSSISHHMSLSRWSGHKSDTQTLWKGINIPHLIYFFHLPFISKRVTPLILRELIIRVCGWFRKLR